MSDRRVAFARPAWAATAHGHWVRGQEFRRCHRGEEERDDSAELHHVCVQSRTSAHDERAAYGRTAGWCYAAGQPYGVRTLRNHMRAPRLSNGSGEGVGVGKCVVVSHASPVGRLTSVARFAYAHFAGSRAVNEIVVSTRPLRTLTQARSYLLVKRCSQPLPAKTGVPLVPSMSSRHGGDLVPCHAGGWSSAYPARARIEDVEVAATYREAAELRCPNYFAASSHERLNLAVAKMQGNCTLMAVSRSPDIVSWAVSHRGCEGAHG